MSKNSDFTVTSGNEALSNHPRESDDALSLQLLREFLSLSRKDKLKVIHFVSGLASSSHQDDN
jgi:hypothetical protein